MKTFLGLVIDKDKQSDILFIRPPKMLIWFDLLFNFKRLKSEMDEKTKRFSRLLWLWFILIILFILEVIFTSSIFIEALISGNTNPGETVLYVGCLSVSLIVIIVFLSFIGLSLKVLRLLKKREELAFKKSFFFSTIFLVILGMGCGYLIWFMTEYPSFPFSSWNILILLPFLSLMIDIIIRESSRSQIK